MTRDSFLMELNDRLRALPPYERSEIIADYHEHFRSGKEEGLSDLEIINKLGSPYAIAKQYLSELREDNPYYDSVQRSSGISVLATIALVFFNLIFVFGPAVGVIGILIGLGGVGLGFVAGGAGLALSSISRFGPFFFINIPKNVSYYFFGNPILAVVAGIGMIALGGLIFVGLFYLVKLFIKVANKYINWNLSIIRGDRTLWNELQQF